MSDPSSVPVESVPPGAVRRVPGWWGAVGLALLAVVLGLAAVFSFVGVYLAPVYIFGGLVYGLIGMIVIGIRWVSVPQTEAVPDDEADDLDDVRLFRTRAQRITLALNLVLSLNIAIATLLFTVAGGEVLATLFNGGIAQTAGFGLIISNAHWAYHRRYILGETRAIRLKTGRHRLILGNRILSWVVWSTYTAAAGYLTVLIVGGASTFP